VTPEATRDICPTALAAASQLRLETSRPADLSALPPGLDRGAPRRWVADQNNDSIYGSFGASPEDLSHLLLYSVYVLVYSPMDQFFISFRLIVLTNKRFLKKHLLD
jgi:hypothetical protein